MLSWCWNEVLKLVRTCTHSGVHHRDGVFRPVCTVYSAAFGTSACHFGQLLQLLQHYPAYQDLNKIGNYWIELITKHGSWNWIEIIKILIRFLSIYWIIENTALDAGNLQASPLLVLLAHRVPRVLYYHCEKSSVESQEILVVRLRWERNSCSGCRLQRRIGIAWQR